MRITAHLLPCRDLPIAPDARYVRYTTRRWGDESTLGDEESSTNTGPLGVVFHTHISVNSGGVHTKAGEGCKDYTMSEVHIPNLDGAEQGRGNRGRHGSLQVSF